MMQSILPQPLHDPNHQSQRMPDHLDHLRHRVEHAPGDPDALCELGSEYLRRGQDDHAAAHFKLALEIDPTWYPAAVSMAMCQHRANDQPAAMETLAQAAEQARETEDNEAFEQIRNAMERISTQ
ncbi:MAG: tetratricopeptide repeat protein [Phycisphaerales bacterium]|nr:tetratricopeptide repeat protein [Phycisphaerales bacterium]